MTREEFESILEEAYIEGYNTAIEDIQEDILDEEAYDLEGEYEYYTETLSKGDKHEIKNAMKRFDYDMKDIPDKLKKPLRNNYLRRNVAAFSSDRNREMGYDLEDEAKKYQKLNTGNTKDYDKTYLGKLANQKYKASKRMDKSFNKYDDRVAKDKDKLLAYHIVNKHKNGGEPESGSTADL